MRRHGSVIVVVVALVLAPIVAYFGFRAWARSQIVDLANLPPPNYEVLPTDDPLTALKKRARQAEHAHDYQRAADLYSEGLADPSYSAKDRRNLLRQRAFAYEGTNQFDRAEADYSAALAIEPVEPDYHAKRGFYFIRRGRYDEALADFRKGSELDPNDGGYPFGEGEAYEKLGQHDQAVERFTEAIRRNAKVANYYRERGSAYNHLGKYREAVADYDIALSLGYGFPLPRETAYSNLGRGYALLQLDEYRPAIADFDAVLKVIPRSSTALAWRGSAHQGLGDAANSAADYKAALAIDPKNTRARDGLRSLGQPVP
jgi:tetratricopeptide (TPR) repeat protein